MNKKAYLEEWNTQNDSYQTDLKLLQEQLNNIKDTKGEYVFNLWPWFGIGMILSSILGGIIGWYALQNVMYLAIMVLVFPGIVYLSELIIHNYKNKSLIESKRSELSLRTKIESDIADLNIRDGNIKYSLAINFVGYHLAYFNVFRDYYGYFAESTVEYGQVFNKSNGKSVTGIILKSFAGLECQVIANNQEWRNVYEVPMFHLIGISKKYRNSKISITKESTMNATFIASQPKRGFKNLSVMDPSQTEKRS